LRRMDTATSPATVTPRTEARITGPRRMLDMSSHQGPREAEQQTMQGEGSMCEAPEPAVQMRTQWTGGRKARVSLPSHRREKEPPLPGLCRGAPPVVWMEDEQGVHAFTPQALSLPVLADPDVEDPACAAIRTHPETQPGHRLPAGIEVDNLQGPVQAPGNDPLGAGSRTVVCAAAPDPGHPRSLRLKAVGVSKGRVAASLHGGLYRAMAIS
jgi:hypothetical protein